jgi:hypothetical protein
VTKPSTTQTRELERCPFCGDRLIEVAGNEWEEDLRARCIGCLAGSGRYRTKAEAVAAWNTRADAEQVTRLREALEEVERLKQHIADLNHDFEAAIKHCDEHHVEGS